MRGLFVFTGLLLVIKFVENISGELISVELGSNSMLEGPDHDMELVQCTTEHNGVFYSIYPETNATFLEYNGGRRLCFFRIIDVNFTHSGEWKINTYLKPYGIGDDMDEELITLEQISHSLQVQERRKIYPASEIHGEDGSYATLFFNGGFDNVTKLYIAVRDDYNDTNYVLGGNGNGTLAGLEMFGQHGLRIPIIRAWSGRWTLIEESGDYKRMRGDFDISWISKKTSLEKINVQWNLGDVDKKIASDLYSKQRYIEIVRPDDEVISLKNTEGIYKVGKVSYKHAGIWKVRYLTKSSMKVEEQEMNVTVVDPREINVVVTTTDDYAIHMLCKTNVYSSRYCHFTSPNGTIIHAIAGVGNDKYEFYGSGYNGNSEHDPDECGLTIRHPSFDDYGLWKCTLGPDYFSDDVLSAYVSTDNLSRKHTQLSDVTAEDISVKRGDKFSIKCSISESLDYCWLRSPNGTNYSVRKLEMKNIHTPNTLPYFGEGLSLGDCGATIDHANDTDAGDWSCRLGVTGSEEIETTVAVMVTDSYVTPNREIINLAYDEPKVIVKLLPSVVATIKYCRWVRPDGRGFYRESDKQYHRTQNNNTCSLFLDDWGIEDVGTWSCYVLLSTGSDEELHTSIELIYGTETVASNMTMNIIVISLVGMTILAGCILGYILHKKRMVRSLDPPAYYNEFDTSKQFPIPICEKTAC